MKCKVVLLVSIRNYHIMYLDVRDRLGVSSEGPVSTGLLSLTSLSRVFLAESTHNAMLSPETENQFSIYFDTNQNITKIN